MRLDRRPVVGIKEHPRMVAADLREPGVVAGLLRRGRRQRKRGDKRNDEKDGTPGLVRTPARHGFSNLPHVE